MEIKKLQKLVLHKTTPLTIPQMKHITGGYNGGTDLQKCIDDHLAGIEGGTCCFKSTEVGCAQCHLSMACAKALAEEYDTNWCCDNCYDSSWGNNEC